MLEIDNVFDGGGVFEDVAKLWKEFMAENCGQSVNFVASDLWNNFYLVTTRVASVWLTP